MHYQFQPLIIFKPWWLALSLVVFYAAAAHNRLFTSFSIDPTLKNFGEDLTYYYLEEIKMNSMITFKSWAKDANQGRFKQDSSRALQSCILWNLREKCMDTLQSIATQFQKAKEAYGRLAPKIQVVSEVACKSNRKRCSKKMGKIQRHCRTY